jgi:TonB family protein
MKSHQLLAEWSQWFWPVFANHLWQATLLAVAVWIASIWLRDARSRHVVWLMAFAKFILPSAALFPLAQQIGLNLSWPARPEITAVSDAEVLLQIAEPVAQAEAGVSHDWIYCGLTALWLAGAAICLARWGWRRRRLAVVALAGEKIETGREAEMLRDLKSRLNVRRQVGLVVSSGFTEPVVWRALRPLILLPQGLAEHLSDGEIESVLKHELFHVKRLDNLLSSLQMFLCCLFWFHPLVWLIDRKLIEERELMCDERVILSGAAPESYAASLWKVVQFGFGWPVGGVSRATGSNLKRRIKFMLNADHRSKSSAASRALAGITFAALIALAASMALFSRDGAEGVNAQIDQSQKNVIKAPGMLAATMRVENLPEIPLVIIGAQVSAPEETRLMTDGGDDPNKKSSHRAARGEMARDVAFMVDLVNQSDRRVTELLVEIQNSSFWANEPLSVISKPSANSDAPDKQRVIAPQESFKIDIRLPLQDRNGDLDLMNHLSDFAIRVTGVKFESDEYWLMAQPGKTPGAARTRMAFNSTANKAVRETAVTKKDSVSDQARIVTGSIQPMTASLRPTITYKEKAQYTQEAKDNNVEGTVVLNAVFGVDGQIGEIEVIRGLPYGLTESAIEAAKKIRFNPALKDGQPAPVRGNLEFSFNLRSDQTRATKQYLRSTIMYAPYTQEAKDNKVEGSVLLDVVFGADDQIGEIKVIRGLPYGLTESAIEEAKKIRFKLGPRDAQSAPVHGMIEFVFSLDK